VNSARQALFGQSDSLEALRTAEGYFRKALALRPQDPGVKTERELARLYLKAQGDFAASHWVDVITALEIVFSLDPNYAQGTAHQTLYEAYIADGDALMASGEHETALADYQKALAMAAPDGSAMAYSVRNAEGAERPLTGRGLENARRRVETPFDSGAKILWFIRAAYGLWAEPSQINVIQPPSLERKLAAVGVESRISPTYSVVSSPCPSSSRCPRRFNSSNRIRASMF